MRDNERKVMKKFFLLAALLFSFVANAQYIEDALRFLNNNVYSSARATALGLSYFGLSDDADGIDVNPAGMTLIPLGEISLGMNVTSNKIKTDFLNNTKDATQTNFYISNAAFVFPITTSIYDEEANERKSIKFGFSYHLDNDFDSELRFGGYNTSSTYIAQQAAAQKYWTQFVNLADSNYNTNIRDNMQQDGFISEDGGLHNFSFGLAGDLNEIFSIGATMMFKFGAYEYSRTYYETDINNVHNTFLVDDIDQLTVKDKLTQELAGITGVVGLQAKLADYCRLGITVKFPTLLNDSEYFYSRYVVQYDKNSDGIADKSTYNTGTGYQSYNIITPFEFTLGASGNVAGLSYSLVGRLKDASGMYFSYNNSNYDNYYDMLFFDDLNEQIENTLTLQYSYSVGLEYKFPSVPLYIRGSYSAISSPYKNKDLDASRNTIGAGIGVVLGYNCIVDAAYSLTSLSEQVANYGYVENPSLYSYYNADHKISSYRIGIRYRF